MPNSVEKTMLILRTISNCRGLPMTLSSICEKTAINKSTASHIIKTLCEEGYMQRVSKNDGYLPGPELFFLTRYGSYSEDVLHISHPLLEWLHSKTQDTVIFAIMKNEKKYIIDRVTGNLDYQDREADILNDDLFRTVTGRVILANIPKHEAVTAYRNNKEKAVKDWPEAATEALYLDQLSKIKQLPVYFRTTNLKETLGSFATPVIHSGICIGALGGVLTIPNESTLDDEEKLQDIFRALRRCAKEIVRRMDF